MTRILVAVLLSFVFSAAALAQSAPVVEGGAYTQPSVFDDVPPLPMEEDASVTNAAKLELRLSNIEDELRSLRGKNEELGFQIRKLTENMDKMQRDVEMRLGDVEGGDVRKPMSGNLQPAPVESTFPTTPQGTTGGDGVLKMPDVSGAETPRDLYNHAFRLLNQTQYAEAAAVFDAFTKQYPKDPLIGNAYYWQGETYYIRRDYVTAADNFRAGFEALPTGPKAADNLLKLAMSLNALSRDKEACVVLSQIVTKFKDSSVSVTEKATSEQKRIGCK